MAGSECTFDKCELSYLNNNFTPSYDGALLGIIFFEIVLMGGAKSCGRTRVPTRYETLFILYLFFRSRQLQVAFFFFPAGFRFPRSR
jgi:hypothetical protein